MKKKITLFLFLSFSLGQTLLFESFNIDDIEEAAGWSFIPDPDEYEPQTGEWRISSWETDFNNDPPSATYYWAPSDWGTFDNPYEEHYMYSPIINVESETNVIVRFQIALDGYPSPEGHYNGMNVWYNSDGDDWIKVLNYEISSASGSTVDIYPRTESFYASIEQTLQLRWETYGTNSYYIDAWHIDNVRVDVIPSIQQNGSATIFSNNTDDSQKAIPGDIVSLEFTVPEPLAPGSPFVLINSTEASITNPSGLDYVAEYIVPDDATDGPIAFSIDFTTENGVSGPTCRSTTDGTNVLVDVTGPVTPTVTDNIISVGGNVFPGIWNTTNEQVQVDVLVPNDTAVIAFDYEVGNSISFVGNNGEINVPFNNNYLVSNQFTIEAYIKVNSTDTYQGFLDFGDYENTQKGFGFFLYGGGWRFYLKTTGTQKTDIEHAQASAPIDIWVHFAVRFQNGDLTLYRDGIPVDSKTGENGYEGSVDWNGFSDDMVLGSFDSDAGGGTKYFDGKIDEVRFWNIARSENEIKAYRAIGLNGDEDGLIGYWRFDEGTGTTVSDLSSINNSGVLLNGATWTQDSEFYFQEDVLDPLAIIGSKFQILSRIPENEFSILGEKIVITEDHSNAGTLSLIALADEFEGMTDFAHTLSAEFSARLFDQAGNYADGNTSSTTLEIDLEANNGTLVNIVSNNTYSQLAKTGDVITVSMAYDEDVDLPNVTFHGFDADTETDLGGETFQALYTLSGNEPEGDIEFSMLVTDYLGNQNTYSGSTDGSKVFYDRTKPELNTVSANSWNPWNQSWARVGNGCRISTNASEELLTISATINTQSTSLDTQSLTEHDINYTFSESDPEGPFTIEIVFTDSAGNEGDPVTATTDNSLVIFDKTSPSDFTVGDVVSTGGNTVANFWNSTNTGLNITIPIESDSTLDSGRVQILAKTGANDFELLGDYTFIASPEVGATKTVSIPGDSVRAITGYIENDTLTLNAYIFDIPGNETEGTESTTRLLIDETPPSLISVSYESDFSDSSLATVGHGIILTFETDVEIQTPTVTISENTATVTDLGSNQWQATYTMQDGDEEGIIPFQIDTLTDIRGNPTEGTSSTTDGTIVTFDNTKPTLSSVKIVSNNADSSWAKVGDTVWVNFEANELLRSDSVNINILNKAATPYSIGTGGWKLFFRQTVPTYLTKEQWRLWNVESPDSDNYSILNTIDDNMRGLDGKFEFKIIWPLRSGDNYNIWKQVSNPITAISGGVDGYEAVDVRFTSQYWGGLEYHTANATLLDGSVNHGNWFYAIGSTASWNGGIPGANDAEQLTELYVKMAKYSYFIITEANDPEGTVAFEIVVTDSVGLVSDPITSTTDNSAVIFDRTAPMLPTVHIESDNGNNTLIAIAEDQILLSFITDEPLIMDSITVTISDQVAALSESGGTYTAVITMTGTEPEGILTYAIDFKDRAGNPGVQVTETTDGSYVNHDVFPPEMEAVFITSSNTDSTWAKADDIVSVIFTGSEVLDNINVTIAGVSATCCDTLDLMKYRGSHVMDESNEEGEVTFLISYTDLGGAEGPNADTTTNNTTVRFDKTSPEFSFTRMATNNVYGDSLAGLGTVDTLAFTISENQRDLNVELAGSQKTPEQEELNFITTHTFSETDEDGWVSFALSMTDSAGNESGSLAETQDGSVVRFDGSPPTISSIIFFSNNTNDTTVCIPGDSLYLNYTTSEVLRTVEITIAGDSPDRVYGSDNSYTAVYGMTGAETEGFIPFNIYDIEDWVGNTGDPASETTNGSTVLFDMTPPADFTLGNVVSNGDNSGIEVPGYWNSSNQYLIVIVPITDDITLLEGGGIQLEASFGDTYDILGDTVLIEEEDLNSNKLVTVSGTDFEDLDDFIEDGNATFRALMWDKAGNMTTSSESATILHIDQTTPILMAVNQKSNNTIADSLAKVGDTDTLIFTASEGLDSIAVQIFNSNALHTGNNQDWVATYVFQESDMDIDTTVFFNISFSDTAGNLVDSLNAVDTTTDGSWIRFDGILPYLDLVSFYSTNEVNPELAVVGDRLILDFISNESLLTQVVTIAGFTADTTFETGDTTRSWRTLDGMEDEGYISFEIGFSDLVGNVGDTVETTTDGSSILFDMTPPADFEIDTVYVSGGTVVAGYWNATNDTVILKIPVPENDETLIGGVYQPQVRFDSGDFTPLGDAVPIDSMDLGGFKSVNITESDGFLENANAEFTALARDKAGNETMGSSDNTIIHIDETFPSLTNVNIHSDNALDTNWATVLNNISLEFMSSEGLSSPVTVMFLDTLQSSSENTGSTWIASRSINENDPEGLLPFSITFSDSAGNEENPVSGSTDGSSVNIDLTAPIIFDLLEGQNGQDIDYYNSSDSITLYWNHSDSVSGIRDAFIALGTDSNTADIIGWTLSGNDPLAGLGSLSLANDGMYFGGVFVRDSVGNLSDTLWGNGVYIDIQDPDTGSIMDGYWVMDLDYAIDSTRLSYVWSNFTDNTEIDYYELAIGTGIDTSNIMDWMRSDSTDSMTITGLSLVRDTAYYTFIKAVDLATNESFTARTDGIYFDNSFPSVNSITPDFISDSAGFLSVLSGDTIKIKFNRSIYSYDLGVNSSVETEFLPTHEYGDSIIYVIWTDPLASYDTLEVIIDSAVAYNTLSLTDTLYFYSRLWGDLNDDYDITLEDILAFNQAWPETDLGPFSDDPPHVRPAPDGDANLTDLAAFAKMWQWKYFNLSFDTTSMAARMTNGLDVRAQGKKVTLKIPESTSMAEILIGESNLDIEKMAVVNPTGTAFLFQSLDTLYHLVQFSLADYRGFDSTLTLIIPETESHTFSAKIQYRFLDNKGIELGKGISYLNVDILPDKFAVFNNYPNPFNPVTTIRYDLPESRNVQIKVFDVLGRTVNTVDYNQTQAGRHTFTWHGKNELGKKVSTGIYFFQLTAGQDTRIQKMLLLK